LRVHHGVLLFIGGTLNLRTLNPFSKKLNQFYRKEFTLSVGNTLGDLRKQYTLTDLITGEGRVAVLVKEIDISFLLDVSRISDAWWSNPSLSELSNNLRIDLIIISN
jgi:hypothetical protein